MITLEYIPVIFFIVTINVNCHKYNQSYSTLSSQIYISKSFNGYKYAK